MGDIGRGIGEMIVAMMWIIVISVPLGIWKAIDIMIWVFHHVSFS